MSDKREAVLVTGAAGFIGFHVAAKLLNDGCTVWGIDNLNDYYSVDLKQARLKELQQHENFHFATLGLEDNASFAPLFKQIQPKHVIHLAAQAGVRYSLENPGAYIQSNLVGFANVLEACRHQGVDHLIYASSSSVYGGNRKVPFAEEDQVDHPVSLYAATKKSNELMAHAYAHLYGLPVTGLRFFTVYGPWGRPDMAYYKFTKALLANETIDVYNHGDMERDFTYVDDVVESIVRLLDVPPAENEISSAPYALYNIGNHTPVSLTSFIETLEGVLNVKAKKNLMPMQPGDVKKTFAEVKALQACVGFEPATPLREGLQKFAQWYRSYHGDVARETA